MRLRVYTEFNSLAEQPVSDDAAEIDRTAAKVGPLPASLDSTDKRFVTPPSALTLAAA
jgi:hypothetical protein